MGDNIKPFAQAVKESGIRYVEAYNAYLQRRIDATKIDNGGKALLLLDAEQQRTVAQWASAYKAAA